MSADLVRKLNSEGVDALTPGELDAVRAYLDGASSGTKKEVRALIDSRRRALTTADTLAGAGRAAATSATLGAYPYAEALFRGPETVGGAVPSYKERLHDLSQKQARFRNDSPLLNAASEVAGSLPLMALPIKVPGVGRLPAPLRPAATGAVVGGGMAGVTGFNNAEGGVGDRLLSAAPGAVTGAIMGGVAGPAVSQVAPFAARKIMRGSMKTQRGEALDRINEVLSKAGKTPDDIVRTMGDEHARGIPSFLMDADPGLARLAEGAVTKGGVNPDALAANLLERNKGQRQRVADQLEDHLVPGGKGLYETEKELLDRLGSKEVSDAYNSAYSAHPVLTSPKIERILNRLQATGRLGEALGPAQEINVYRGTSLAPTDAELTQLAREVAALGKMERQPDGVAAGLSTRSLHLLKQGLDTIVASDKFTNQLTGRKNPLGGALQGVVTELNAEMKRLNPLYAQAQAKYAEPAKALETLRISRDTASTADPARVRGEFSEMSSGEQDMYRLGQAENLRQKPLSMATSRNAAEQITGTPNTAANLETTTDPEVLARLNANLNLESDLFTSGSRIAGGSRTANKQEAAKAYDEEPGLAETVVKEGIQAIDSPGRTAVRWVSSLPSRAQPRLRAEEAASILGASTQAEVDAAVALMKQRGVDIETQKKVLEKIGARSAIPAGAVSTSAPSPETGYAQGGPVRKHVDRDALVAIRKRLNALKMKRRE